MLSFTFVSMRKFAFKSCAIAISLMFAISLTSCLESKKPPKTGLALVDVSVVEGKEPKVIIPDNLKMPISLGQDNQTPVDQFEVLDSGNGDIISDGQNVEIGQVVYAMPNKQKQYSSYDDKETNNWFPMFANQSDPNDLYPILKGLKVGAVIVQAIPSSSGTGQAQENSDSKDKNVSSIENSDTYDITGETYSLVVMQVLSVKTPLTRANGISVSQPNPNLPQVTLDQNGIPSIKIPDTFPYRTDASASNSKTKVMSLDHDIVRYLKKGDGKAITDNSSVSLQYTGWLTDGKQFESSWNSGRAPTIDYQSMIDGWKNALKDVKVGSQLLIVLPPNSAYGEEGNDLVPSSSVVIFVVDILDVV